jgi:hypothetical protein
MTASITERFTDDRDPSCPDPMPQIGTQISSPNSLRARINIVLAIDLPSGIENCPGG